MPWVAPVVAGAVALGGAAIGAISGANDRAASKEQREAALQQWLSINVPDPKQQQVYLERFKQTGQLDPQLEQALKQDASQLDKVQGDPRLKEAQLKALSSISDIANHGGLTLSDQSNIQKSQNDVNAIDRGKRDAIMTNMDARGMGGSGLSMAAQMQSAQDASMRNNESSLNTLGSARQRALEAIMGGGQLAGSMRNQDYTEKSAAAKANDAINNFNTQNMQSVQQRNMNRANDAASANLQVKQQVADSNTQLANQEQLHNKSLAQQDYENQLKRVAGATGQYNTNAKAGMDEASAVGKQWADIGGDIGKVATAYGSQQPAKQPSMADSYDAYDEENKKKAAGGANWGTYTA